MQHACQVLCPCSIINYYYLTKILTTGNIVWVPARFYEFQKGFMGSSKNIFNGFQEDFYEFQPDFYGFQPDFMSSTRKIFMSSSKNVLFYGRNPSIQGLTQPARWLQAKSTAVK